MYPIIYDSSNIVLSMPPIINGKNLGLRAHGCGVGEKGVHVHKCVCLVGLGFEGCTIVGWVVMVHECA